MYVIAEQNLDEMFSEQRNRTFLHALTLSVRFLVNNNASIIFQQLRFVLTPICMELLNEDSNFIVDSVAFVSSSIAVA